MPIVRRSLTREERGKNLARAQQLRDNGVDIEIPQEWREKDRCLDIIVAPPCATTLTESRTGAIIYAILVRLVARSGLLLTDCELNTSWDDQIVLQSFHEQGPVWRLFSEEYLRKDVLNQRIENGLSLSRKKTVEGYILATGLRPVPSAYRDLAVPYEIVFRDQFENQFRMNGMMSVVRRSNRDNALRLRGTGLYGSDATQEPIKQSVSEQSKIRRRDLCGRKNWLRTKDSVVADVFIVPKRLL